MGVTSILPDPSKVDDDHNTISFYVGTKRGKLKKVTMKSSHVLRDDHADIAIQDIIHNMEEKHKTPYPIFSMTSLPTTTTDKGRSNDDGHVILAGSGDRYITVWEEQDVDAAESSWRIQEKLGPHTGWVKDLALSSKQEGEKERFIFSIGCNCIEVWKTNMLDDGGGARRYDHVHKLKIESSVDMGMTLSSDILCLATSSLFHNSIVADQTKKKQQEELKQSNDIYWLFAGGVDGRIHRWTICNNSFRDAEVVYAPGHDGRVNALLVCHKLQVAVSIGSDGCINCWMLDMDASSCNKNEEVTSFQKRLIWSMNVTDSILFQQNNAKEQKDTTVKLTASCILLEQHDHAIIGIGTACGKVFLANIIKSSSSSDRIMSISLLEEWIEVESSSSGETARDGRGCTIHSLATQNNHIIIGHSDGISIWQPCL